MKNESLAILLLIYMISGSLQLENQQHAYYSQLNPYNYQNRRSYSQPANDVAGIAVAIIIVIAIGIIVGIGVLCYYCCKGLRSRASNNIEYVGNPPFNPQITQPLNVNQIAYQQPPTLPYHQTINQPIQAGSPAYPSASVNTANDQYRLNSPCDVCSVVYKQGEQPRAMVSCRSRHIFHLSCLNQAIRLQREMLCPQCNQNIPQIIKLFCVACKTSNATVNLLEFRSSSDGLDLESIKIRYGECCPSCTGL